MPAVARDVEIRLLHIRRHARRGTAALHIHDHQRHLRHRRPAQRLGLERNARTAGASDRHASAVTRANRHRDGRDLVLRLDEAPAVLGQFAPQQLHDVAPRRDGITRAEAHARRDQSEGQRLVPVHHHLLLVLLLRVEELKCLQQVFQRMTIASVEARQRVRHHRRVLAAEPFFDQLRQLHHIQIKNLRQQTHRENVLALVLARAAHRLDRQARDVHADMAIHLLPLRLRRHMVRVVEHDAAGFQRADVVLVGMLVKAQQHVRIITRAQHLARADAHLEDGRPAGDRGGNRHERHDLLLTAARESREETADGLDAILRVTGDTDDRLVNLRDLGGATRGRVGGS